MLDRAKLNICCYSSGDRSNVCWIQHKISREFPLWHESSHYMDQLTHRWLVLLLTAGQKVSPFSKPLCTCNALHVAVRPYGWVCAYTDARPNPRCSSLKVIWVGHRPPDRDFGMRLGIGLHLVLTKMSSHQESGSWFEGCSPQMGCSLTKGRGSNKQRLFDSS